MPAPMPTRTAPHPLLGRVLLVLLVHRSALWAELTAALNTAAWRNRPRRCLARFACQDQNDDDQEDDDEVNSDDDASQWDDLPEEDVLDAFDQDDLEADIEPLDGWRGEEDDEPNWFD